MSQEEETIVRELYADKLGKWAYCTAAAPLPFRRWNGVHPVEENTTEGVWPVGTVLKIVMVSRFDDCGLTDDLTAKRGYQCRVKWDSGMIKNIRRNP